MNRPRFALRRAVNMVVYALILPACTGPSLGPSAPSETSAVPTIRPEDVAGRWGFAAYYNEADRPRIEAAARRQCNRPVIINRGPTGGITMPIANQVQPQEQSIKSGPGGKNYIGPPGEPGGPQDSEIVSFDGKILVTRTIATDEVGHLNSIYVRCGPKA